MWLLECVQNNVVAKKIWTFLIDNQEDWPHTHTHTHTHTPSKFINCAVATYTPPPCISYALVQATVGVGTVLLWDLILIRYHT